MACSLNREEAKPLLFSNCDNNKKSNKGCIWFLNFGQQGCNEKGIANYTGLDIVSIYLQTP